jgi:hypothetical protein
MRETVSGDLPALAECVDQFVPFLDYDIEICRVLCSTDVSVNRRGVVGSVCGHGLIAA